MNYNFNDPKAQELLNKASQKLGKSPEELKKAVEQGSLDKILNKLKPEDTAKLQAILSDKSLADKFLATPQARALLKKLFSEE